MLREKKPKDYFPEDLSGGPDEYSGSCKFNLQRKAALAHGGPVNHKKNVFLTASPEFDLNSTIFKGVSGLMGLRRMIMKAKLGNEQYWKQSASNEIDHEYEEFLKQTQIVPKMPDWNNYGPLLEFMQHDCNFDAEHADGSFMDHLYFCRDYSNAHYKTESPRVLFLHSIMGVGTNVFPMEKSKESKLGSYLTEREMRQVAAFPSVLRMLNHKKLIDELNKKHKESPGILSKIKEITFHRVIDNEKMTLTGEELIVALNYQMIHQIDFLPCANWSSEIRDPMFQLFVELHEMMTKTGILDANVQLDMSTVTNLTEKDEFGMPMTLGGVISKAAPKAMKRKQLSDSVAGFSKKIGHSLAYEIVWEA